MEDGRRRDVGLFRYSLIREAADLALRKAERGALVREIASRDHVGADGIAVRVGRSTLDRWVRTYRAGGFDALLPAPRASAPRTPGSVLELAVSLKKEAPARTAVSVAAILRESGRGSVSTRTIQRHFARLGLNTRPDGSPPKVYGRFEAAARNDLWTGDAMHGPSISGKKAYLLAFIDDHSRLLPGYLWTFAEDTVRLESALRPGLAARGVPKAVLVDNGSAFVAAPFLRACAVLGVRLIHARPRAATTKALSSHCTSWVVFGYRYGEWARRRWGVGLCRVHLSTVRSGPTSSLTATGASHSGQQPPMPTRRANVPHSQRCSPSALLPQASHS